MSPTILVTSAGISAMDDFPRLNTVTLCPAATASRTDVSDIWPLPPTNRTLNATDLLLLISFVLESRLTRVRILIKVELAGGKYRKDLGAVASAPRGHAPKGLYDLRPNGPRKLSPGF